MLEDSDMGEGMSGFIRREFGGIVCDEKSPMPLLKCMRSSCDMYVQHLLKQS